MSAGNEIGDLLLDIGLITQEELAKAHQEQAKSGDRLTLVLERMGLVSYHQLKDALELQFGVNFYSLSKTPPAKEISDALKLDTMIKHKVIPVASAGTQYTIAMVNPDDLIALDSVRVELKSGHLKKVVCTADEFEFLMRETYKVNKDGSAAEAAKPAAKPADKKMPAKNQLQSLFGDDDDDDDLDDLDEAPKEVKPEEKKPAAETKAEAKTEAKAEAGHHDGPGKGKPGASDTAHNLPAMTRDIALGAASKAVAPDEEPEPIKVEPIKAQFQKVDRAEGNNGSSPPAVQSSSSETLTSLARIVPASAAQALNKLAQPVNKPLDPTFKTGESAHLPASDTNMTNTEDHVPVVISIEDVVAGIASDLVESTESNQVIAKNTLLEDVVESELGGMEDSEINRLKEQQNSSIMLLAHEIIGKATQKRCSDIHLEPDANGVNLRYFLHGQLLAECVLPGEIHDALVSSYKIIAGLDTAVLDKPQDKKITTKVEEDQVELRITTLPSNHGEMVAISMRFVES